jgi:hypothetical protein
MQRFKSLPARRALAVAAGAVITMACAPAVAQTQFTGFTTGCFGAACVPSLVYAPATDTLATSGLSYANSTFDVISSGGFAGLGATGMIDPAANLDNLGSWTLSGDPFTYSGSFTLRVSFTAPPGTTPDSALFTSTILGNVTSTDNGGVDVDFDNNPVMFTFDGGTFTLKVADVSLTPHADLTPVASTGFITVSVVPEPETYSLILAGLGAVGFMVRRRRS